MGMYFLVDVVGVREMKNPVQMIVLLYAEIFVANQENANPIKPDAKQKKTRKATVTMVEEIMVGGAAKKEKSHAVRHLAANQKTAIQDQMEP